MKNANHPAPDATISVLPIRCTKSIATIKKTLADNPRDFALFVVGINTAFRASELLALTVGQVRNLNPGDTLAIREKKTGNKRNIEMNKGVYDAIQRLLASPGMVDAGDNAPLFQSRKGAEAITVSSLNNLVKKWAASVNLAGNYGSHTLRKTWGYHARVTAKRDIPTIMTALGHATQKQTLTYLCISDAEVTSLFMDMVL